MQELSRLRKPIQELKSHGDAQIAKLIADSSPGAIKGTLQALASIEAKLDELFSDDAPLTRLHQLIASVHRVGKCIAVQVIVDTNEFKNIKEGKDRPLQNS